MAPRTRRSPVVAIAGAALGCAVVGRHAGFVSPNLGAPSTRSASPVALFATKAEIEEVEKQVRLLTWAYETAVEKGMPQAAMMKGKADQAVAALAAMKDGGSAPPPMPVAAAAPVAAVPVAAAPAMAAPSGASNAEIAEAEKQARLLVWAYETAVAQGMPQAAAAKVRADQATAKVQALKAAAEGRPAPAMPVASAPAAAAPVAAAMAAPSGASKAEIAEAEKHAKLLVWAYETAVAQGMPQAAAAKAKADQAVTRVQALKAAAGGKPSPAMPVSTPSVAAPAPVAAAAPSAPVAASGGGSKAEIEEAKKQAKLLTWAAETAEAKGMPQAAMMRAKADQAVAALEALKAGSQMAYR